MVLRVALLSLGLLALAGLRATPQESVLYTLLGKPGGAMPYDALVADANGALYGTTAAGGATNLGSVFRMKPGTKGYTLTTLYSFRAGDDAKYPYAELLPDATGALYGTTYFGGKRGFGAVFKLTPSGGGYSESILYSFQGTNDGVFPYAGLIADNSGTLYGTASRGGGAKGCSSGCGIVFKLTPSGSGYLESILYSFQGGSDGADPFGRLIADTNGNLYGTTSAGGIGSPGNGTVFELTPSGSGYLESVLYKFAGGADGSQPCAGLIADASGNLYGTTIAGGAGNGTVFELTGSTEKVLYSFKGGDGATPYAGLLANTATGAFYGTTYAGGAYGKGTIFELTPSGSGYAESVLYSFKGGTDGAQPAGAPIADLSGTLYGTTQVGGKRKDGTVYKLTP